MHFFRSEDIQSETLALTAFPVMPSWFCFPLMVFILLDKCVYSMFRMSMNCEKKT
nr:MAG TPA: hypothetical protein [Caudoviricetes sp.]